VQTSRSPPPRNALVMLRTAESTMTSSPKPAQAQAGSLVADPRGASDSLRKQAAGNCENGTTRSVRWTKLKGHMPCEG